MMVSTSQGLAIDQKRATVQDARLLLAHLPSLFFLSLNLHAKKFSFMVKLNGVKSFAPRTMEEQREMIQSKTRKAAKLYEKTFLREMVKAMRQTVPSGGFIKSSMAENIFQEKLDHEYVEKWGEKGGIGLADLIYDQIMDRFGAQMGMQRNLSKPQGPIRFKYQPQATIEPQANSSGTALHLKNLQTSEGRVQIQAPWSGILVRYDLMADEQWLAEIEHESGLRSKLVFKGDPLLSKGTKVEAGQNIGLLAEQKGELFWQVNASANSGAKPIPESVASSVSL